MTNPNAHLEVLISKDEQESPVDHHRTERRDVFRIAREAEAARVSGEVALAATLESSKSDDTVIPPEAA